MLITGDTVYAELERQIILGQLKPRERLLEATLCQRLGVSRTLLREVFRRLEGAGLVILEPNRGCAVRDFTAQEIRDIYYLRIALEKAAVPLILQRVTDDDLKELRAVEREFEGACRHQDIASIILLNLAFHRRLDDISGNTFLRQYLQTSRLVTQQVRYMVWQSEVRIQKSVEDHQSMLAALTRRNTAAFERAVMGHLTMGERDLERIYPVGEDSEKAEQSNNERRIRRRGEPQQVR
jgi:DNA-binding GntR family transcriptional regulator